MTQVSADQRAAEKDSLVRDFIRHPESEASTRFDVVLAPAVS